MSSSIIDFVNCHTEKDLGINKYINDKFLDVKELNSEKIYQDNVLVATQTEIDILQQEIDNITPDNPNGWINGAGQTTTNQQILFTDNSVNGAITTPEFTYSNISDPTLTVGGGQIISSNNNMKLESQDYILTTKDIYLQGTADVQRALTIGITTQNDNVKQYVDINNLDFICNNGLTTKTRFELASSYDFDNDVNIGDITTTKKLNLNGLEVKLNSFKYNYYVSNVDGNDTNNGSITQPFKTIGACMTVINALSPDINVVINLSAGNYTENVSITKSGVSLVGSNPIACVINGDISFNMVQNSSFYAIGVLFGVQINGTLTHTNNTVYNNTLSISNIISVSPSGKNNLVFQTLGAGLLGDCTIRDSVIYVNNDTIGILVNNSALFMVATQIQNNPNPLIANTIQNYVYVSGAGRFNAFGVSMYNSSNSASVKALIEIGNTSNATSSTTINNCILLFTNGVATTTGAIMNFSNSASANTVNFYNNFIRCFCSVNSPNNYFILKSSTGTVNFSQGNNLGRTGCHTLPNTGAFTGWTKTTFSAVV